MVVIRSPWILLSEPTIDLGVGVEESVFDDVRAVPATAVLPDLVYGIRIHGRAIVGL